MKEKQENLPEGPKLEIPFFIFIISGTLENLSALDFSYKNVKCINLASNELKDISEQFNLRYHDRMSMHSIIMNQAEKIKEKEEFLNVLLPIDFHKKVSWSDLHECIQVTKLLFPSDLQLKNSSQFTLYDNEEIEWHLSSDYIFQSSVKQLFDGHLIFPVKMSTQLINDFIGKYFDRIEQLPYVQIAMDAYLSSFGTLPSHMAFISLCIATETIIPGREEQIFRIKRLIGLMCATNMEEANIIFKNMGLIYELRSGIVHGGKIDRRKIKVYLPYLRSLVSYLLIRLIQINIPSLEDL